VSAVPTRLLFNGYRVFFSGVNQPKSEAYHSHPSNVEAKKEWNYNIHFNNFFPSTSSMPYVLFPSGTIHQNFTRIAMHPN